MGVHDLWSIVEPVRESVPLYSLSGKTLAVDLSLWVCEAQRVQAMMGKVTRPHLRNLFFRVSSLTLMGVKLVFVMEGEAPKLKAETMSKRAEGRFGVFNKAAAPKCAANTSRGRFRAVLRECSEMLDYLGVPWVTAAGEAEAMCAFLDSQGLVDGCITNDGDAFLYGARTVYRNFNMNTKDPQVDCYKTSRVQAQLHLCRENLVGLAILLGCDYIPKGIPGVGKEQALKLIQTVKGQTLLQRFVQWRETTGVSEGATKKFPHCHICQHPGSAKAHERGGCVLCDSKQFCQPQDFDYQCPCDWHRHQHTHQASSVEANIRKKTLASPQFPFTEIIKEFLVSRDKPVSSFKWRQPNLLLIQKFAFDKMEWPEHYTSEKVLVLMTYAALMNRKYGRQISSQIMPLRILKPRVRNAVACFEVIWKTPDHYVFPEDRPKEDQHEVRTVEEQSLFGVAFPEVVDGYLRDKAMAEETKTKKKKSRSKKEKASDEPNSISDLMSQMTIQSTSSEDTPAGAPALLDTGSNASKPEVIVLDTPLSHRQHPNYKEGLGGPDDCPNTPLSRAESDSAASPSVSAVIEALHLSDIDWDVLSFTSSPPPQTATDRSTEPKRGKATHDGVEGADGKRKTSGETERAESKAAPDVCPAECPLRERVLMRNAARATNKMELHDDELAKLLNHEVTSIAHVSSLKSNLKPDALISSQNSHGGVFSGLESAVNEKELAHKVQGSTHEAETQTCTSKRQSKTMDKCKDARKPPQRYKFVRTATVPPSALPKGCPSGQGVKDRNMPQNTKRSVCMSVCSSSEDSDVENMQFGPQRKTKIKPMNKLKDGLLSDFRLKPVSGPKTIRPAVNTACGAQIIGVKTQQQDEDVKTNRMSTPAKNECQGLPPANVHAEVFLRTPASPISLLDSDDSAICSESPLPLAERLRLKFMKGAT